MNEYVSFEVALFITWDAEFLWLRDAFRNDFMSGGTNERLQDMLDWLEAGAL